MNRSKLAVLMFSMIVLVACLSYREPKWVPTLVSKLSCGMTMNEVAQLTAREIRATIHTTGRDVGTHFVDGKMGDVWLGFEEGRLVTVASGYIDGLTSIRSTPKINLCTGELTFWVNLSWITTLGRPAVYLDSTLLDRAAFPNLQFPVDAGDHLLLVEPQGFESIAIPLSLGPEDPGVIWIDLTEEHLEAKP